MTQHQPVWPISRTTLAALPPDALTNQRTERYRGGTFAVPLAGFAPADQHTLQRMYRVLHTLWTTLTTAPAPTLVDAVRTVLDEHDWHTLVQQIRHLRAPTSDATLAVVIHELRGGSFTALVGTLNLLQRDRPVPRAVPTLVVLVRDHLHTVRSLVPDLDPPQAQADQQAERQSIDRLVEKWRYAPAQAGTTVARVHLDVQEEGAIAARSSELAAMDGVLTNLITNAVQFAADGAVYLSLVPHTAGHDVRVVVANRLQTAQQHALRARFGADWRGLFASSDPAGGAGLGLRIGAAYVAECYGLPKMQQVVEGQYLAATVIEDAFVAYFHWPLLPPHAHKR